MKNITEDMFWNTLITKHDEGMAHITSMIERSGDDEFMGWLGRVMEDATDDAAEIDLQKYLVAHCAIVGAIAAWLALRDKRLSERE